MRARKPQRPIKGRRTEQTQPTFHLKKVPFTPLSPKDSLVFDPSEGIGEGEQHVKLTWPACYVDALYLPHSLDPKLPAKIAHYIQEDVKLDRLEKIRGLL